MADIDHADSVLVLGTDPMHEMPILELRIRKAVRHTAPSSRRHRAPDRARRRRRGDGALRARRGRGLPRGARRPSSGRRPSAATVRRQARPPPSASPRSCAPARRDRLGRALGRERDGAAALDALRNSPGARLLEPTAPGLIGVPDGSNARGLREVGALRAPAPASRRPDRPRAEAIKEALLDGELEAIILCDADPIRDLPDGAGWAEALRRAAPSSRSPSFDDASTKARRRRPPRRGLRREGGHRHPPRRPPPAPPPIGPPARRVGPSGKRWPSSQLCSATKPRSARPRTRCGHGRRGPVLRRYHARRDRRHAASLAGRARPAAWPADPRRRELRHLRRAAPPAAAPGVERGLRLGDVPRPLGRRRDRAQRGAAVPEPDPAASSSPSRTPSGWARPTATRSRCARTAPRSRPASRCGSECRPGTAFLIEGTATRTRTAAETVEIEQRRRHSR